MEKKIVEHIQNRLLEIEKEHQVEILYALESGSRAWGFESTDSDYDVRFLYRHPSEWYLSVFPQRDVIEYPIIDEFDYSGWDIQKALFLLRKSNPVLFEWLQSPIVYRQYVPVYDLLNSVAKTFFSKISATYHYLHMAQGNYRQYLKRDQVRVKKYFYVLRPILACMWIEKYDTAPPVEFEKLLPLISNHNNLHQEILNLLHRKRNGLELGEENRIDIINDFLEEQIDYFESVTTQYSKQPKPDPMILNSTFRTMLKI